MKRTTACTLAAALLSAGHVAAAQLPTAVEHPRPESKSFTAMLLEIAPEKYDDGDVGLRFCVDAAGHLSAIELATSSGNPKLDRAVKSGIRHVRFFPARDAAGQPVATCDPPFEMIVAWRKPPR